MRCDDKSAAMPRVAARKERSSAREIGPDSRQRIGAHLRAMYQLTLSQPVPDRFTDLIARLDTEDDTRADDATPDGSSSQR